MNKKEVIIKLVSNFFKKVINARMLCIFEKNEIKGNVSSKKEGKKKRVFKIKII